MPIHSPIFAPAIVLVLWSLFMLAWLAVTRLPGMAKAGIPLTSIVGSRGVNLEGVLPDRVNWKAHNYAHLMEQPTLFYATVVILRIGHSIVQATWNRVIVRFTLFSLATVALLALAVHAAMAVL